MLSYVAMVGVREICKKRKGIHTRNDGVYIGTFMDIQTIIVPLQNLMQSCISHLPT